MSSVRNLEQWFITRCENCHSRECEKEQSKKSPHNSMYIRSKYIWRNLFIEREWNLKSFEKTVSGVQFHSHLISSNNFLHSEVSFEIFQGNDDSAFYDYKCSEIFCEMKLSSMVAFVRYSQTWTEQLIPKAALDNSTHSIRRRDGCVR